MAVARLKGDPKVGITGMRKRIFPDGDSMKEKVHKMIQQLVEVERFKFYKNVDSNSLMAISPIGEGCRRFHRSFPSGCRNAEIRAGAAVCRYVRSKI